MSKNTTENTKELCSNRKARHHYEILETFEAGIVLTGTEIKSLRDGGASLQDAYVKTMEGELWLVGASIAPYRFGNIYNHAERRERKMLMHKREIVKLRTSVEVKGLALIPLSMYLKKGRVKVLLALAKGKKSHDKRESVKERDDKRDIQRLMKG
jgi:SsrA-binding protein